MMMMVYNVRSKAGGKASLYCSLPHDPLMLIKVPALEGVKALCIVLP